MVYETALVVHPDAGEKGVNSAKNIVAEALKSFGAEIVIEDDWGIRSFAQKRGNGLLKGHYLYFMYQGPTNLNVELERRFRINENVVTYLILKLGKDSEVETLKKKYVNPFNRNDEKPLHDQIKDKKVFVKRKTCWFTANKTAPDWKDLNTYIWLINEFGKISPARAMGVSRKMQRRACSTIKQARNIGFISHLSDRVIR